MSREYAQNQQAVCDLFGRDAGGSPSLYTAAESSEADQNKIEQSTTDGDFRGDYVKKIKPQFSENLWEDALKRHCDSRQNVRSLLDRYIKPHH